MRPIRLAFAFAFAAGLAAGLAACDDGGPTCPLAQYETCFAPAECHYWVSCNVVFGAQDEAFCMSFQAGPRQVALAELRADVAAGLREYDAAAAAECAAFLAAIECPAGERPPLPEACRNMVTGGAGPGDACSDGAHCTLDSYCALPAGGTCAIATCVPYPVAGEVCDPAIGCAPELLCVEGGAAPRCFDPREGAACEPGTCRIGLDCVNAVCVPAPAEGQPCSAEGRCRYPLECVGADLPEPDPVCAASDEVGAPCSSFCVSEALWCDRPVATVNGTCRLRPASPGEACTPASGCARPLLCAEDTLTCRRFEVRAAGESCGAPLTACDWQHRCEDDVCSPLLPDGAPCNGAFDCASYGCDGTPRVCGPPARCPLPGT